MYLELLIILIPKEKHFCLPVEIKKGKDQEKFYKDLIAESEVIIEKHEKELENERRNQNDGK